MSGFHEFDNGSYAQGTTTAYIPALNNYVGGSFGSPGTVGTYNFHPMTEFYPFAQDGVTASRTISVRVEFTDYIDFSYQGNRRDDYLGTTGSRFQEVRFTRTGEEEWYMDWSGEWILARTNVSINAPEEIREFLIINDGGCSAGTKTRFKILDNDLEEFEYSLFGFEPLAQTPLIMGIEQDFHLHQHGATSIIIYGGLKCDGTTVGESDFNKNDGLLPDLIEFPNPGLPDGGITTAIGMLDSFGVTRSIQDGLATHEISFGVENTLRDFKLFYKSEFGVSGSVSTDITETGSGSVLRRYESRIVDIEILDNGV